MSKKSKGVLLSAAILLLISLLILRQCNTGDKSFAGKVTRVIDGDTVEVLCSIFHKGKMVQTSHKVRLHGIDSPEREQAYGRQAKEFVSGQCFGQQIKVINHGKDKYGRVLGTVILSNGKNLNQEIVKAGFAWHYRRYSKNSTLQAMEDQARRQNRGLWQDRNPVPPWKYRRKSHSSSDIASQCASETIPAESDLKIRTRLSEGLSFNSHVVLLL